MNIKEIIDAERWRGLNYTTTDAQTKHDAALDRIEAAVMAYNKRLEKQVSTLEKAFIFEGKKYEDRIKDLEVENAKLRGVLSTWSYAVKQLREYEKGRVK